MGEKKRRQAAGELPAQDARAVISKALDLQQSGRPDDAWALCEPLIDAAVRDAEALHYLGYLAIELGRPDRAPGPLERAITLQPGVPYFHNTLAIAFMRSGRLESAIEPLQRAIALGPELHEPPGNLGNALHALGRHAEAAACYHRALRLAPQIGAYWSAFAQALSSASGVPNPELRGDLLTALGHEEVDPKSLVRTLVSLLRSLPRFEALCRLEDDDALTAASLEQSRAVLEDPLLLRLLESAIVADAVMERMLTRVRRTLLRSTIEGRSPPLSLEFVSALAQQCFATEYAWFVSEDEGAMLATLENEIVEMARAVRPSSEHAVALYAAYRPLRRVPGIATLPAQANAFRSLFRQQVLEPAEEEALQREIRALHPIEDPVSRAVQEQYEDNPFPRWVRVARFDHARSLPVVLKELFPHRDFAPPPPQAPRILVAGCGTGIHPVRSAFRFEGASILAVDLSRASLAHALRKTRELGLRNLEYAQADVLRLGELDQAFDLIECIGVLHHLRDPMAGWRSLTRVLAPGGLMRIGLYSELGRSRIVYAQAFARRTGLPATEDGIRRLRRALFAAAESDPELAATLMIHDIYSLSGFRDLLLHVQEHRFTVPQVASALRELELEFLGFEVLGPQATQKYLARFPANPGMDDLANWQAFEESEPDTFAGMYRFWVRPR